MVTNIYLKIALALLSLVCVALALIDLRTIRTFENFRPLVIRIDDLGRAEAINYHNFEYKPQDAEAKYFLSQFTKLYYRRNRYTIQDDFAKSLYFLDGKLANGILDTYRKDDIIRKFDLAALYRSKDMTAARRKLTGLTSVNSEKSGMIAVTVSDRSRKRVAEMAPFLSVRP